MIEIGNKYIMNPPIDIRGNAGKSTIILEKVNEKEKALIETLYPHHANGMDWYKTEHGYGREDWFEERKS